MPTSYSEKYPPVRKYIGKSRQQIAAIYLAAYSENNMQDMRLILQHVGSHAFTKGKRKWERLFDAIEKGKLSWIRGVAGQYNEEQEKSKQNQRTTNEQNSKRQQSDQNEQKTTGSSSKTAVERAFVTLGLNPEASQAEIKKKYLELVKMFHPDKNKDNPHKEKFENMLKEVIQAREVLKNAGLY